MARLDMDHRWGMRKPINLDVQLICQPGAIAPGWLTDVSVSGAFVRTELILPLMSSVRVVVANRLPAGGRSLNLSAYVARRDRSGVGLEWWQLSPGALHRLFSVATPVVEDSSRTMACLRS